MFETIVTGRPRAARPALAYARRIGATLASLACALGPPGWARADNRVTRTAQRPPSHDPSAHATRDDAARSSLPPALPDAAAAWGLPGFEQMALARNPTLRQAAAQLEAALSRSFQAGLYPNPTAGYIQEQIGALGESTPTSRGVVARGKPSPGELVGGFVRQEIITGGKLRLSRAKFAEEANAARWQLEAQKLRVLNGVRIRFFEVLAAERLIDIHRELVRLNDDAVRTTEELENVGQANEPDLLQARVEARRARRAQERGEPLPGELAATRRPRRRAGARTLDCSGWGMREGREGREVGR
jgi:outer membrane protein TolC